METDIRRKKLMLIGIEDKRSGESDLAVSKRISGSTCAEERPFARKQQVMGKGNYRHYSVKMSESVRRSQSASRRRNRLYRTITNNIENMDKQNRCKMHRKKR